MSQLENEFYDIEKENRELKEAIRYWSYCTRQGMLKLCPEREEELSDMFRKFNVCKEYWSNK